MVFTLLLAIIISPIHNIKMLPASLLTIAGIIIVVYYMGKLLAKGW